MEFLPVLIICFISFKLNEVVFRFFAPETPKSPFSPWQLAQCDKYSSSPRGIALFWEGDDGVDSLQANKTLAIRTKPHPNLLEMAMEYLLKL
jgi:hypothetical protein